MPGRHWHEALLLVLAVAFAAQAWASGSEQQTITATYPAWAQAIWYGGLILGSLVALVGIIWHGHTGLLIERAALLGLAGVSASYGLAFLIHSGRADLFHAVYVVVFVGAFAAVNIARAQQIRREIQVSQAARLTVLHALQPPPEAST